MTATDPYIDEDGTPDATVLIGDYWPADGPHSPSSVAAAALGIDELAHYLARATTPWGAGSTVLPPGPNVYRVVTVLRSAFSRLDQVLDQVAAQADSLQHDHTLYDDRRDGREPGATAPAAAALRTARRALPDLIEALGRAHNAASHLGHDDSKAQK